MEITNLSTHCFHCGQPIAKGLNISMTVLGAERHFCCHGCHFACKTIVESGFESFYTHREGEGVLNAQVLPEIFNNLTLYDRSDIQRSFVHQDGDIKEAALILENIHCAACLWLNEQHLLAQAGIIDVQLDYATHHARVRWDDTQIQLSQILTAIAAIGYIAHPYDPKHREQLLAEEKHRSIEKLFFAGLLGMPVMAFSIATYWMGGYDAQGHLPLWEQIGRWSVLIVTAVMIVYSGTDFFVGAWRDLRNKRLGMDFPIVIGLVAAWAGSLWASLVNDDAVYLDSIAMFIFFILLARVFELRGRLVATDMLDRLLKIVPMSSIRLDENDAQLVVAVADLTIGDRILVKAGEVVPVDGLLLSDIALVHEAHLTGESVPIQRRQGDWVLAGSLSIDQPLIIRVERTATQSTTSQMQQSMLNASSQKPKIAQLADQIVPFFVAAVLFIAFVTFAVWLWIDSAQALPNLISVLIITCPCALALATPVALALAAGKTAAMGVVTLKPDALQTLTKVDMLVLDKTGTLTTGKPTLTVIRNTSHLGEQSIREIAHLLESQSEHPLAYALRLDNPVISTSITALQQHPSQGMSGEIAGQIWRLGRLDFVTSLPLAVVDTQWIAAHQQRGATIIGLSVDNHLSALFVIEDPLREDAILFIQAAKQQGFKRICILSGDQQQVVDVIATQLGISAGYGNQKPDDKLAFLQTAQQQGNRVMMIGDGINDASTLAAATLACSFNHATDLAQLHSDVLLMGQKLMPIINAIQLASHSQHLIRQNLTWALIYNLVAIPFAAFGLITPWMAALGMSLSSLFVVFNALRLRAWQPNTLV